MRDGYDVDAIISVSKLAWRVFKECKESSEDLRSLSSEVVSLHVALKETEELVAENGSSMRDDQAVQLKHLIEECQNVLNDVDSMLKKYDNLGSRSQRTWERLKWDAEAIAALRAGLISNASMLSAYNTKTANSSTSRTERKLNQFMEEVRSGKRDGSIVSTVTVDDRGDKEESWRQLQRELEDIGVSPDIFSEHKQFIIGWFQHALSNEFKDLETEGGPQRWRFGDTTAAAAAAAEEEEILLSAPVSPCASIRSEEVYALEEPEQPEEPKMLSGQQDPDVPMELEEAGLDEPQEQAELACSCRRGQRLLSDGDHLRAACRSGRYRCLSNLLQRGIDPNTGEETGMPALNIAAMYGPADTVKLLLNQPGTKVNVKNHIGHTPLSLASWYGHVDVVKALLENREVTIDTTDFEDGQTPLSLAAEQGHDLIVTLLLNRGADPNTRDRHGLTPLAVAIDKDRRKVMQLLLGFPFTDPNLKNNKGWTPLASAIDKQKTFAILLLLQHNVDMDLPKGVGTAKLPQTVRNHLEEAHRAKKSQA